MKDWIVSLSTMYEYVDVAVVDEILSVAT